MYFFAVFVLLSLATMALTMLGDRPRRPLREARVLLAVGWGVALAWLANFDMWLGWGIGHLRYAWVGVTLTGAALGGAALLAYAVFGFFLGLHRKLNDQAEQIERTEIRRVA